MPETSATIKYWIDQRDEYPTYYRQGGEWQGAWTKVIADLADITGRETELVTEYGGQVISAVEALDMLARGELDLVLKMPAELSDGRDGQAWTASGGIYVGEITGYILKDSPQAGEKDFENCYWAIDSALKDMLKGTPFDGHTVDYTDRAQMYRALENGDVYGVLDTRGSLDYEAFAGHKFVYRQCGAVSIPYAECAYVKAGDAQLLNAVNTACERNTVTETGTERGYINLIADAQTEVAALRTSTCVLGGAAIVLAAACAVLAGRLRSGRRLEEAKLRTVLAEDNSKELLELDLRKWSIRSYNDFAIFGERGREIPNPVSLKELSELLGYDFIAHYSNVSTHISRKYSNRLVIHVGGEKLYIAEEGMRTGKMLMITMTRM